ncbi:MAG: hypothetical protein ACYSWO_27715 [Planctomycetota bacterium]
MRTVKLYGGPRHQHEMCVDDLCHRIECPMPHTMPLPRIRPLWEEPHFERTWQTCTYYLRPYMIQGKTEEGAKVFKEQIVGVFEGDELLSREYWELERDMSELPWQWARKPNFLTEFDQWFEYTLDEIGWKRPKVKW